MSHSLTVKGMHCKSCKMLVEDELEDMGATDVNVSLDEPTQTGTVIFNHSNPEQVITAIEDMNYEVSR